MKHGAPVTVGRQVIIDQRRRMVAALSLRKLTQRELVEALRTKGLRNPDTGRPYGLATVNRDLKALCKAWRLAAAADIAERKGLHLAELDEVKRAGWAAKDLAVVLRALGQEARVLGLDAPWRADVTWRSGLPEGITADEATEAQRQFAHMMAEAADKHDDRDTTNNESD